MKIVRTALEMQAAGDRSRRGGSLGFVPTMGYLHEGHLSLVRASKAENDRTAVSIYVNPTQFVPGEDFEQYPRDEARDLHWLEKEGVDWVFLPSRAEIYPEGFSTYIEPPQPSRGWCGEARPGHFRGVCTVVAILFNIIQPDRAYFGRKDAQQAAVIRRMTQDLRYPVEISVQPIVRESDGLAMSSRNVYLSLEERRKALILSQTLARGIERFREGECEASVILQEGIARIESAEGVRLDYLGAVNRNTFESVKTIASGDLYIGSIYVGKTRLIDNMIFDG
ncbi:MAG: pantoate--beta-alanine ligase [Candidatus Omnitrophota bacterium]